MNQPQVIYDANGQPAFAVIPWEEYERLTYEEPETSLSDAELYDRAMEEGDESFPIDLAHRLLAGQNPVVVYRTHRTMTQADLATAAGIDADYLSQIESGESAGSNKTLAALAHVLNIDVDDLVKHRMD